MPTALPLRRLSFAAGAGRHADIPDPRRDTAACAALRQTGADEILLESLVASWRPTAPVFDCRWFHRVPVERPILITEWDDAAGSAVSSPRLVTARDVSLGGLSFAHRELLPCRVVAVTFVCPGEACESVAVRLNWCRFTRDGRYHSGGPFIGSVQLPIGPPRTDWGTLPRA